MGSVGRRQQHGCEYGDAAEMAIRCGVEDVSLSALSPHKQKRARIYISVRYLPN